MSSVREKKVFMSHTFFKILQVWGIMTSIALLSGCHHHTKHIPGSTLYRIQEAPIGNKKISWISRAKELRSLETFSIRGTLELHPQGHRGGNFPFQWIKTPNYYQLRLFDPFGGLYMELTSFKHESILKIKNKSYKAKNAEVLVRNHLGYALPVNCFSDWLKGISTLGLKNERVMTQTNHVLKLHQAGWLIRYLRYHQIRNIDLPTQFVMIKKELHARILIAYWQI